jgi:hypothetical protein
VLVRDKGSLAGHAEWVPEGEFLQSIAVQEARARRRERLLARRRQLRALAGVVAPVHVPRWLQAGALVLLGWAIAVAAMVALAPKP